MNRGTYSGEQHCVGDRESHQAESPNAPRNAGRNAGSLGCSAKHAAGSGEFRPLAANLALFAIVLTWLAVVLRWRSAGIAVDQSHSLPIYRVVLEDSRLDRILRLVSLCSIVGAGALAGLEWQRRRLSRLTTFLLVAMLMTSAFWCLVGYKPSDYWSSIIGTTSPLIYAMCLGVFAGLDTRLWVKMRLPALAIAYGSGILGLYYTARWTVKGTFEGPNPTVEHLQVAFWFGLCALILRKSCRWRHCLPALIPMAWCIPMAIMAGSRSFTGLTVAALIVGLSVPFERHRGRSAVRVLAVAFLALLVLGGGLGLLCYLEPERVSALQARLAEDTRSSQYRQFFDQVPLPGLITGLGPKATYTYNERADYEYLDNQFLFILFKFGLPVLLGYWAVVIYPGLRLLVRGGLGPARLLGFFFGCWTLAALGVSIFHSITISPQCLLAVLLAGHAMNLSAPRAIPALAGFERPACAVRAQVPTVASAD